MKVRIKFAKYGAMKFIGHLDVMRFFQKAIRRAAIAIKYSEGFSPHPVMSFAAPLGVGIESRGEYMDIEVTAMTAPEEIKEALNREMVEGIEILSVHILPDKAKNAMASVAAASYLLYPKKGSFPIENLEETVKAFYAQKEIPYRKETKKNVIELNLKQAIYEMSVKETSIEADGTSATVPCVAMTVNASSSGNIKPSVVYDRLCEFAHVMPPTKPFSYQTVRLEIYTDLAESGTEHRFVPLGGV